MEKNASPPPFKQDNSYNYYSDQKSNKQQNYYYNPIPTANQHVPYSYHAPYYQYNPENQEINQIQMIPQISMQQSLGQ